MTEIKLPNTFHCPVCNAPITNASATRHGTGQQFKKGTVIICSGCTVVLHVGDSALERMSADQVNALSSDSRKAIAATKLALVRILDKKKRVVDISQKQ